MEGVWRTRVGYAGGAAELPTYRAMADHTECFQVDFDPSVVTFEDLLELFWQSHDPTREPWKVQYASLVLAHDADQLTTARESAERVSGFLGSRVATRIEELTTFWPAEDYHQKYVWKHTPEWVKEFPLVEDYSLWAVASALGKPTPHFGGRMGEELGAGSCPR